MAGEADGTVEDILPALGFGIGGWCGLDLIEDELGPVRRQTKIAYV